MAVFVVAAVMAASLMTAVVVAAAVMAVAMAVLVVATASSAAVAATALAAHAVDESLDLVVRRRTHYDDFALEVERLARKGVVHVDRHLLLADFEHKTLQVVAVFVEQGDHVARIDVFLVEMTVHTEHLAVEMEHALFLIVAIGVLLGQDEIELVALVQRGYLLLKGVEREAHSGDKLERMLHGSLLDQLGHAVFARCVEFVGDCHVFVFRCFHIFVDFVRIFSHSFPFVKGRQRYAFSPTRATRSLF